MRLTAKEIAEIINAVGLFIKPPQKAWLYLYGSRTDDQLKGGDIDLLLLVDKTNKDIFDNKYKLLAKIKEYIGDQKIDLLIIDKNSIKKDLFASSVIIKAILLKEYNYF